MKSRLHDRFNDFAETCSFINPETLFEGRDKLCYDMVCMKQTTKTFRVC